MRRYVYIYATIIFIVAVYISLKYKTYSFMHKDELYVLSFEHPLAIFFNKYLEAPKNKEEFETFLKNEGMIEYLNAIRGLGYNLIYDSINEETILYTNGMDWDDDNLDRIYALDEFNFCSSLFIDGDMFVDKYGASKYCQSGDNITIKIKDVFEPDSILIRQDTVLYKKLRALINCTLKYYVSKINEPVSKCYIMNTSDAQAFVILDKENDLIAIDLYADFDAETIKIIKYKLLSQINEIGDLEHYSNIRIGMLVDVFFSPLHCEEI